MPNPITIRSIVAALALCPGHAGPARPGPDGTLEPRTTDWGQNPSPVVGDWGFDRPGYPQGLYIHGVTVRRANGSRTRSSTTTTCTTTCSTTSGPSPWRASGRMNLAGLIVTPVLTDGWGFSHPDWIKTATEARDRAPASGMRMDRIPPITVGTEAESERAGERKDSAGARLYVRLINEQFEQGSRPAR